MSEEFSWSDCDKVFPTTMAVAVYRHASGDVIIRQEDQFGDQDDVIFVPMANVPLLIEALAAQYSNWEVDG